jgi:hypothetical protein
MVKASGRISSGRKRLANADTAAARDPNAITNVSRYNDNGTTQSSGTAAISVDR